MNNTGINDSLVSILIPVYNINNKLLNRSIYSVLKQSYRNIEVIIIDDGSVSECSRQCDEYAACDSRVRVIHQKNEGVSSARNVALDQCKGDWVMFVDPDDELLQGSLEEAVELAEAYDVDILYGTIEDAWEGSERSIRSLSIEENAINTYSSQEDLRALAEYFITHVFRESSSFRLQVFTGPVAKLFKRSIATNIRFPNRISIAEDNIYNSGAVLLARRIGVVNHCWYRYWHRSDSALASLDFSVPQSFCPYIRKYVTDAGLSIDSYYGACCNIFFAALNSMTSSGILTWRILKTAYSQPWFVEAFDRFRWYEYAYPKFSTRIKYRLSCEHHPRVLWYLYRIWNMVES